MRLSMGRPGKVPAGRLLTGAGLMVLFALLATACASSTSRSTGAVGALAKVAAFKSGEPALVFVYTDG